MRPSMRLRLFWMLNLRVAAVVAFPGAPPMAVRIMMCPVRPGTGPEVRRSLAKSQ
jgi:hypothetical protein